MAKTDFVNGTTVVTAEFLDSIFLTDGGHKHDGGSDDGSASKIDPETETDWGTNAAAPAKTTDSVSEVLWTFAHAAAGIFSLAVDALKGVRFISANGGKLYIGSAAATGDHDLECADIDCSSLDASGAIEANSAVISTTALIGTVTAANVNVTDDLVVLDDASVGGDLTVTGGASADSVTTNLVSPVSGTDVYFGDAPATANRDIHARDINLTGDLDCADVLANTATVSGNASVGGNLSVTGNLNGVASNAFIPWTLAVIDGTGTVGKDSRSRIASAVWSPTGVCTLTLATALPNLFPVVVVTPIGNASAPTGMVGATAYVVDSTTIEVETAWTDEATFSAPPGQPVDSPFSIAIWAF